MTGPKFLVIAHERSGSSWLVDNLAPACLGEIWGPDLLHHYRYDPKTQPVHYLRQECGLQDGARGAKVLMHGQVSSEAAAALLEEVDRVVLLGRLNLTETAVSMWFARRFNDWQAKRARSRNLRVTPSPASIPELRKWLRRLVSDRREWTEMLTASRVPVLRLWYEGLTLDAVNAARALLCLPEIVEPLSCRQVQRDEAFYRRVLANYDEINATFGKRYGRLFGPAGDWWRSTDYPPAL